MHTERILTAIKKYKEGIYNEIDFQKTMESIESSIKDDSLQDYKSYLHKIANDLEYINFMVDSNLQRSNYLKVIKEIENYINR